MLDRFRFWKKKNKPADDSAQHLANLLGTSVAGYIPESPDSELPKINLYFELFSRHNLAIAKLVIIAGLLKDDESQRSLIIDSIESDFMGKKSFECYLFNLIMDSLNENSLVSISEIRELIPKFEENVYGEDLSKQKFLKGNNYKWSQILSFEPTQAEINKAIELVCSVEEKRI